MSRRSCDALKELHEATRARPIRGSISMRRPAGLTVARGGGPAGAGVPQPDRQRRIVQPAERPDPYRRAQNGATIELVVDDEGPGIPEGKLEQIFDRFYSERPKDERFGQHSGPRPVDQPADRRGAARASYGREPHGCRRTHPGRPIYRQAASSLNSPPCGPPRGGGYAA